MIFESCHQGLVKLPQNNWVSLTPAGQVPNQLSVFTLLKMLIFAIIN